MKNLLLACAVFTLASSAMAADTTTRYNQSCVACHASGAAGAPRTNNEADWAPRLAKGMDVLLVNTKNGINAMPPKGMCFDCTDEEFTALIEHMAKPK